MTTPRNTPRQPAPSEDKDREDTAGAPRQLTADEEARDALLRQIAAEAEDTISANTERLKELARRLPGGDAHNYIVVLCEFFASEYHWGLDKIAGLDFTQMISLVEQALRRRAQRSKRRTGRPRKGETDKERLVIAALIKHHRYQNDGSVDNSTPATTRELAELASSKHVTVSVATVSRFFKRKFREHKRGCDGYIAACNRDARVNIGMLLALWQGEVSEHLGDLLPHESGREGD
jgi:hypothetical protein